MDSSSQLGNRDNCAATTSLLFDTPFYDFKSPIKSFSELAKLQNVRLIESRMNTNSSKTANVVETGQQVILRADLEFMSTSISLLSLFNEACGKRTATRQENNDTRSKLFNLAKEELRLMEISCKTEWHADSKEYVFTAVKTGMIKGVKHDL